MDERTPISTETFHEILRRDFGLLRAPACAACEVPRPLRRDDAQGWSCALPRCQFGCDRLLEWMVAQYCKQYRPRDLCDTGSRRPT
ncbi:MAG: hypothetical protein ACXWG6_10995 [Usitatibacter sp.]